MAGLCEVTTCMLLSAAMTTLSYKTRFITEKNNHAHGRRTTHCISTPLLCRCLNSNPDGVHLFRGKNVFGLTLLTQVSSVLSTFTLKSTRSLAFHSTFLRASPAKLIGFSPPCVPSLIPAPFLAPLRARPRSATNVSSAPAGLQHGVHRASEVRQTMKDLLPVDSRCTRS